MKQLDNRQVSRRRGKRMVFRSAYLLEAGRSIILHGVTIDCARDRMLVRYDFKTRLLSYQQL